MPRYLHDCDACTYLGEHLIDGAPNDLYVCVRTGAPNEYVARGSDDGPDYASGSWLPALHHHPGLWEAYRRTLTHHDRTVRTSARHR